MDEAERKSILADPKCQEGFSVLLDAGYTPEKAATLIAAAKRNFDSRLANMDPLQMALHIVKLRKAILP